MYKFKENDILHNTLTTRPKYTFSFYSGSLYINNNVDAGVYETGSVRIGDLNLTPTSDLTITTDLVTGYVKQKKDSAGTVTNLSAQQVTGSAVSSFTITREFIRESGGTRS